MLTKIVSGLCATAMSASIALAVPASAMPLKTGPAWSPAGATEIQFRDGNRDRDWRRGDRDRNWRGGDRDRDWQRADRDRDRRDFRRDGRHAYWNGHRGFRERRDGYREYNGFWFPPAAFALGVITGAIANSQPRYAARDLPRSHVEWCFDRYRSYRASDNTFQPYNGPRAECRSPYY